MKCDSRKAQIFYAILSKRYKGLKVTLAFNSPLEILVATILSAQCTDKRVNIVTEGLFKIYKTVGDYAQADLTSLQSQVRSTGFYKNKAKNIKNSAKQIISEYNSQVPSTMEELVKLPGVARKTANIVLINGYGKICGVPVDTHVKRLSKRLGFSDSTDPGQIERDLMSLFSKSKWSRLSNILIDHGRNVCIARKPKCSLCLVRRYCPSRDLFVSKAPLRL